MKNKLLDDLAIRLATTCKNLGLDDADEDLLWRYLMHLPNGQQLPGEIALALKEQSESSPVMVLSYSWTATFPERFYKPSRSRLAKLGMGLKAGGVSDFNNQPLYVRSLGDYETDVRQSISLECFKNWYDDITNCLREDGCNWEPPTTSDVQVVLTVKKIDLAEKLDLLTKSQFT